MQSWAKECILKMALKEQRLIKTFYQMEDQQAIWEKVHLLKSIREEGFHKQEDREMEFHQFIKGLYLAHLGSYSSSQTWTRISMVWMREIPHSLIINKIFKVDQVMRLYLWTKSNKIILLMLEKMISTRSSISSKLTILSKIRSSNIFKGRIQSCNPNKSLVTLFNQLLVILIFKELSI